MANILEIQWKVGTRLAVSRSMSYHVMRTPLPLALDDQVHPLLNELLELHAHRVVSLLVRGSDLHLNSLSSVTSILHAVHQSET